MSSFIHTRKLLEIAILHSSSWVIKTTYANETYLVGINMVISDIKVAFLFHSTYLIFVNNVEICLLPLYDRL